MPDNTYISRFNSSAQLPAKNIAVASDENLAEDKAEAQRITERITSELLLQWKKDYANDQIFPAAVANVHEEILNLLLSIKTLDVYDDIARQVNLAGAQRNMLPKIVWQLAQTSRWNELEVLVRANLPLSAAMQNLVIQLLEKQLISELRVLATRPNIKSKKQAFALPEKKIEKIAFRDALEKFPRLGEQLITASFLNLKYFPDPVRPSIKNWIADYHDMVGMGKHDVVDRGNYLFHSGNGKNLSSVERQKVTIVLRSLDENLPVEIDTEKQKILFASSYDEQVENDTIKEMPSSIQNPAIAQPGAVEKNFASQAFLAANDLQNFAPQQNPDFVNDLEYKEETKEKVESEETPQDSRLENKNGGFLKNIFSKNATTGFAQNPEPTQVQSEKSDILNKNLGFGTEGYFSNKKDTNSIQAPEEKLNTDDSEFSQIKFASPQKLPVEQKMQPLPDVPPIDAVSSVQTPIDQVGTNNGTTSVQPQSSAQQPLSPGMDDFINKLNVLNAQEMQAQNLKLANDLKPLEELKPVYNQQHYSLTPQMKLQKDEGVAIVQKPLEIKEEEIVQKQQPVRKRTPFRITPMGDSYMDKITYNDEE